MQGDEHFKILKTQGAAVTQTGAGAWHLEIPSGERGRYRVAQIDDYTDLRRRDYPWRPPFHLSLRARASHRDIPGTWGFGLWNDPFGMAILRKVELVRLPALPNCAWFFYASPDNYLSLRDDLPANGGLAATFRSPRIPPALSLLGAPLLPLALVRPAVRLARRLGKGDVKQSAVQLEHDPTGWHQYEIERRVEKTTLSVDGKKVLETNLSPLGPLGLVIWIDNQYAALRPEGKIGFGTLANEAGWVEVEM